MLVKGSTSPFVGQDGLINPLMTDLHIVLGFQPSRYLFRAPVLPNLLFHPSPSFGTDAALGFVTPSEGQAVGLFGTLTALTTIAPQFPTDGHFMHVDGFRNLSLLVTHFLMGINLVSLFLGKLLICVHRYSFDLVV